MTESAFASHRLRGTIDRLIELQDDAAFAVPGIDANESYAYAREKIATFSRALKDLIAGASPGLVSLPGWTNIDNQLQNAVTELTNFIGNKNPGHLVNAASHFEAIQNQLWAFGPVQVQPTVLPEVARAQADRVKRTTTQLVAQREELAGRIAKLSEDVKDYALRLEQLKEAAVKERGEAAAAVARLDHVFATKETERATAFAASVAEFEEQFKKTRQTAQNDAAGVLKRLGELELQAAKIVQVVGNIGVTGNYQQIAVKESQRADNWRVMTLIIFGAGMTLAVATFYMFWGVTMTTDTLTAVGIRLLYAIAITAPAWYTARESARHRTNADRARQTELELASIGPFIELLPDERKVAIREKLVESYFGRSPEPHEVPAPIDAPGIIKEVAEAIKAAKK
jgi:hypothetical protein